MPASAGADALREQIPTPPWEDLFLVAVCAALDLQRDAERTAGQAKTRVAGFKQAAEQWGPEDPRDWRQEFWRAEIGAAAAADRAATTQRTPTRRRRRHAERREQPARGDRAPEAAAMSSRAAPIARTPNAGARAGVARCAPPGQPACGEWPARGPADRMLLLKTAAYPTLLRYRHPQLGRLCVPGCNSHMAETLAIMKVGFDNGCYHGLDPAAVCRMYEQIAAWPSMGARVAKAYGQLLAGVRDPRLAPDGPLPRMHRNLLWCTVPDVVRCSCGRETHCRPRERKRGCAPVGDSIATAERFAVWHPSLAHLPLAYVLQDGCEQRGLIPWDAPSLTAVFVGGSDRWRYGAACADLVRDARRRRLLVHFGRISSLAKIRYIHSIGATSFDSSRYSRWRDITLATGLAAASQPPQLRLVD